MLPNKIRHESLQELLQGHLEPYQRKLQVELGDVPIGKNGLTRRMWQINYLRAFIASLDRCGKHKFARNFTEMLDHTRWTAETTLIVELLRLIDGSHWGRGAKARPNLTVELYHERLASSSEIPDEVKREEGVLYDAILSYRAKHPLKNFRDRLMFHLDLEECVKLPGISGDALELSALLVRWYSTAAGVVTGGEPRYVTVGAPTEGLNRARALRRLMLDSLRYQIPRWPRKSQIERYGLHSDDWYQAKRRAKEDNDVVAFAHEVATEMGEAGIGIRVEYSNNKRGQNTKSRLELHTPNESIQAEFIRRFNATAEKRGLDWRF